MLVRETISFFFLLLHTESALFFSNRPLHSVPKNQLTESKRLIKIVGNRQEVQIKNITPQSHHWPQPRSDHV